MSSRTYTVAQITDCHLLADGRGRLHGSRPDETLSRVLEEVNELSPDLVVASGDLTEDGSPAAYDRLRRLLSKVAVEVACIPGNHDDPGAMRSRLTGNGIGMPESVRVGPWRVLLLDTTIPGRPEGRLGESRLASLNWHLREARGHPKIVFLHHQPLGTGSPWIDCMGLQDGEALMETLQKDGEVAAIAFGHIHHAFSTVRDGIQVFGSPATSFQALPRHDRFEVDRRNGPGFRWFRLFADGLLETGVNRLPVGGHA